MMPKLILVFAIIAQTHEIAGNDPEIPAFDKSAKYFSEKEFNETDNIYINVPEQYKQEIQIKNCPLLFEKRRRMSCGRESWWTRKNNCSQALTRRISR